MHFFRIGKPVQALAFGRALNRVVERLRLTEIRDLLTPFFDQSSANFAIDAARKQKFADVMFEFENALTFLKDDSEASAVLGELKLESHLDRQSRAFALTSFQGVGSRDQFLGNRYFWYLYNAIVASINLQVAFDKLVLRPKTLIEEADQEVFEVYIDDYKGEPLRIVRLERILTNLRELYEVVSNFQEIDGGTPSIAYADSGSGFTIALQGVALAIRAIHDMFGDAWRVIRFAKNEKMERDLSTVRDGLSVVAEIRERMRNGELDLETGTRLEHQIESKVVGLLQAGVLPAEVESAEEYDRAQIIEAVRDTKLLGPGPHLG